MNDLLRHTHKVLLAAAAVVMVGAALGVAAAPAAAKGSTPCWKTLINDWYDGRIDGTYPIHCYRDALKHLPADVDQYSSARDDIRQALQKRITQSHNPNAGGGTGGTGTGGTGGKGPGTGGNGGTGPTNPSPKPTNPSSQSSGPINDVFNAGKPAKADSIPIPLLVLGGLALLLMAAGAAGFVMRRTRLRKLQLASAASFPPNAPPGSPPEH